MMRTPSSRSGEAAFDQGQRHLGSDRPAEGRHEGRIRGHDANLDTGVKGEEKQGLATGSENYWCINDKASDADKKATEDFLSW